MPYKSIKNWFTKHKIHDLNHGFYNKKIKFSIKEKGIVCLKQPSEKLAVNNIDDFP